MYSQDDIEDVIDGIRKKKKEKLGEARGQIVRRAATCVSPTVATIAQS